MASYTLTPAQVEEVAYISGVAANGTVAATSFATWNGDEPATYSTTSSVAKWGSSAAGTGATVTYGFDTASNWTTAEQAAFTTTLDLWAAVANVTFVQVSDAADADIDFKRGTDGSAYEQASYYQGGGVGSVQIGSIASSTISIDTSVGGFGPIGNTNFDNYGGYVWMTMLHEEGHALGLGHSGPYNDGTTASNADADQLSAYDSREWSIMSYVNPSDTSAAHYSQYVNDPQWGSSSGSATGAPSSSYYQNVPTTWMPLDILAIQQLYGVNTGGPLSGGQTFGFNTNITGPIAQFFNFTINTLPIVTIYDSGLNNTLDLSGFSTNDMVDLNQGAFSSVAGLTDNIAIAYGSQIDTVVAGAGSDTFIGNNDGETFISGSGTDYITGGGGADTFEGTQSHLTGDYIFNFGAGDKVNISNASYASFAYTFTNDTVGSSALALEVGTLNDGSGTFYLTGLMDTSTAPNDPVRVEHLIVSQDANSGVDLTYDGFGIRENDFTGDGHADILWRDAAGTFSVWDVTGNTAGVNLQANAQVGGVDPSWTLEGAFDFNGDGRADLYWFNPTSGEITIWESTGTGFVQNAYVNGVASGWTMAGLGDFNGDGQTDILWRNTSTGAFTVWDATDTASGSGSSLTYTESYTPNVYYNASVDTTWHLQGVGDFTGNGMDDLVWRNNSGLLSIWDSTGTGFTENVFVNASVGVDWHIAGIGDFSGDGKDDLLWRNNSGELSIWTSTGTGFTENTYVTSVDPAWVIVQVGDFNDDGKDDILFRNSNTGVFTEWDSTGSGFTQNVLVNGSVPTSWSIITHPYDIV